MAIDYTAYPVIADLVDALASANITLTSAVSTNMKQLALDQAVSEIEMATGRQFKPGTVGEIRYYDGSGTGEMVIDDYSAITDVSFFALPAQPAVAIANYVTEEHKPFAMNRIRIFQGPANSPVGYYSKFPAGRLNIKVTGTFGWASIPPAVWAGVLGGAAGKIANRARLTPNGMLVGLKDLDQDFKWSEHQLSVLAGWEADFNDAKRTFMRSLRDVKKRQKQVLI